jgi:hypothetical protein
VIGTSIFGQAATAAILDHYDFTPYATVVDVGGTHNMLLAHLLQNHETLLGVLLDLPALTCAARRHLKAAGVADRCMVVAGDFLMDVPAGGDVYVLARVIRNLDDTASLRLLTNCRRAMADRGRLLVVEHVLSRRSAGRERTEAQYGALLALAGLTITDILPTRADVHLIEARPA